MTRSQQEVDAFLKNFLMEMGCEDEMFLKPMERVNLRAKAIELAVQAFPDLSLFDPSSEEELVTSAQRFYTYITKGK